VRREASNGGQPLPSCRVIAQHVVALVDDRAPASGGVQAAVEAGTAQPAGVSRFGARSTLGDAVEGALRSGAGWIWLLDGRAVPGPAALGALLDAAADLAEDEVPVRLLASVVVEPSGALHPAALPQHEIFEKERSVDAARRHLVQLRAAAPGSLLIARSAATRFPPPARELAGDLHLREWTVRILRSRDDAGYLVPASRALRADPGPPPRALWAARIRLLAAPGWSSTERLWEAYRLATGAPGASPSRSPRRMTAPAPGAK
jgi:hypothetical protein